MKKLILTMMFILLTLGQVWAVSPFRVKRLVGEYRHKDGFELVSIGPLGVGLLKHAVTRYGDLDKSDQLIILDFGDAPGDIIHIVPPEHAGSVGGGGDAFGLIGHADEADDQKQNHKDDQ